MFLFFLLFAVIGFAFGGPIHAKIPAAGYVENTPENLHRISSGIHKQNIEELSGQFEGDILLNPEQRDAIFFPNHRNGLIDRKYQWSNRTIPYELSDDHTKDQQDLIRKALDQIQNVSCVKFVPRTDEEDFIEMTAFGRGCYSYVGKKGGNQQLNLQSSPVGKGCFRIGTIMHEFLHGLGFFHVQSTPTRDEHVKIEFNHIREGVENNFLKYNTTVTTDFNVTYDYNSVLHYSAYAFTKDGYATIVPNNITYINRIGQREDLSLSDIKKLNLMYDCDSVENEIGNHRQH